MKNALKKHKRLTKKFREFTFLRSFSVLKVKSTLGGLSINVKDLT